MGLADDAINPARDLFVDVPRRVGSYNVPEWQRDAFTAFTSLPERAYPEVIRDYIHREMRRRRNYENAVAFVLFGVHL